MHDDSFPEGVLVRVESDVKGVQAPFRESGEDFLRVCLFQEGHGSDDGSAGGLDDFCDGSDREAPPRRKVLEVAGRDRDEVAEQETYLFGVEDDRVWDEGLQRIRRGGFPDSERTVNPNDHKDSLIVLYRLVDARLMRWMRSGELNSDGGPEETAADGALARGAGRVRGDGCPARLRRS
ncbi:MULTISPECIES: hypothetical protein [Frankiaceae]|uniref:hypothetical protein n=1 Tax=Frankiaceae TaxID=74712 RepID=UPI001041ECBE|nr:MULTISPECIES: hypothetical protein [Frankiaceae]MBE3204661.1 hypothetical protein [Parafrankia sp. CH37]